MNDSPSTRTWPALDLRPVSDLVQAALIDYDATAVDERAPDDWRVFFTTDHERDRAAAALRIVFPDLTITTIDVADENWAARSQADLRAVRVGHILIAPPWDLPASPSDTTRAATDPERDALVIVIQPSMGFGTGHHATTRLCLAALLRCDLRGQSVLDIGTGSGILAIAASLLGSSQVTAIDNDIDAITSAHENVDLNNGARVSLAVAELGEATLAPADLVLANLTGAVLIAAATILQGLTTRDGRLILSGLTASEAADVLAAFAPWRVEHRSDEDEWVCFTLMRA